MNDYISLKGLGEQASIPPGVFKGVDAYTFFVKGDQNKMQQMVDKYICEPTGGDIEAKVISSLMVLTYLDVAKMMSTVDVVGWLPDRECSLAIPVIVKGKGVPEQLMMWMPYVIINNGTGMVTGREIWGFFKEYGTMDYADDNSSFVANTTVFKTFSAETQGMTEPLISVIAQGKAELGDVIDDVESVWKWIIDHIKVFISDIELLLNMIKMLKTGTAQVINIKQFQDVEECTKACYQQITACPITTTDFKGVRPLLAQYQLKIFNCQSHNIVDAFGLEATQDGDYFDIPVHLALKSEVDFSATHGTNLWTAS